MVPCGCKGAVRACKRCAPLADLAALHLCHAAAKVLSEPANHLHRLQIFQTACRHGHFRLSVHNSSDSGTVEFGMHAFTVGAAVVSLLRWLSELRERLLKVKQDLPDPAGNAEAWWPSATGACHSVVGCVLPVGPAACTQAATEALPPLLLVPQRLLALQECLGLLSRLAKQVFAFGGTVL